MIYVDPMKRTGKTWGAHGQYASSCHLFTNSSIEELHIFAEKIGLKKNWFQDHRLLSHYDLTPGRRRKAIEAGAKEVSDSELRDLIWKKIMDKR